MTPQFFQSIARHFLTKRAGIGFFRTDLGQQILDPVKDWAQETIIPDEDPDEAVIREEMAALAPLIALGREAEGRREMNPGGMGPTRLLVPALTPLEPQKHQ